MATPRAVAISRCKSSEFFRKVKQFSEKSSTFAVDLRKSRIEMQVFTLHEDDSPVTPAITPSIVTMGVFDGVHSGHAHVLQLLQHEASLRDLTPVAVTFGTHPAAVLGRDVPPLLTTPDEKLEWLAQTGIPYCVVLPFDREMAALTARQFMEQVLHDRLGAKVLLMGHDHRFGSDGRHDPAWYDACAGECGMEVLHAPRYGEASSTKVRQALLEGRLDEATLLLGHPYTLSGVVEHGRKVGRQLGFPTANLRVDSSKLIPQNGAYAVRVRLGDERFDGMMNIGICPTFECGNIRQPEVHILDFDRDIYGEVLHVELVARLRDEQRFASAADLVRQLSRDCEDSRRLLGEPPAATIP